MTIIRYVHINTQSETLPQFFHQSFFILVEELVQLEQLTDVTLACGDGTNHQVYDDDNRTDGKSWR